MTATKRSAMPIAPEGRIRQLLREDPHQPGKQIDPMTGVWPVSEWGMECGPGFISLERFARLNAA